MIIFISGAICGAVLTAFCVAIAQDMARYDKS